MGTEHTGHRGLPLKHLQLPPMRPSSPQHINEGLLVEFVGDVVSVLLI